jgi:hypothetical protein
MKVEEWIRKMTINVDAFPVENEQEALVLMRHHLRLAAMYFEATPAEFEFDANEFSASAQRAFVAAMEALYPDD